MGTIRYPVNIYLFKGVFIVSVSVAGFEEVTVSWVIPKKWS